MSASGNSNGSGSRIIRRGNVYWAVSRDGTRRYQAEADMHQNEGEDPFEFARSKLIRIEEYNQLYGVGDHNPYTHVRECIPWSRLCHSTNHG